MSGLSIQSNNFPTASTTAQSNSKYTVQNGDTVSDIASRNGISVDQLLAQNPQIRNPDVIYPGDQINVSGSGKQYTVQSGDTISDIGQRLGVSESDLLKANPQISNPDMIYPGDVLRLPGANNAAPSTPTAGTPSSGAPSSSTPSSTAPSTNTPVTTAPTPSTSAPSTVNTGAPVNAGPITLSTTFNPKEDGGLSLALACAEGNTNADGSLRFLGVSRRVPDGYPANLHQDPGDDHWNKGRLSYSPERHGYASVDSLTREQCEQKAIAEISKLIPTFESAVQAAGFKPSDPNYRLAVANCLDLANQSGYSLTNPNSAFQGKNGFLNQLEGAYKDIQNGVNPEKAFTDARVRSFYNDQGRLVATVDVVQDQARRNGEIYDCLKANGGLSAVSTTPAPAQPIAGTNTAVPKVIADGGYLNKGATGEDVKNLQRLLIANGASIKVTGSFDNATAAAVEKFKADPKHPLGTAPDQPQSAVGKTTWDNLVKFANLAAPPTSPVAPVTPGTPSAANASYVNQNSTSGGSSACQVSSLAMVLQGAGWKGNVEQIINDYGFGSGSAPASPVGAADAFNSYARAAGLNSHAIARPEASLAQMQNALRAGHPIIVNGFFTSNGHVLVVTGMTKDGNYIVNDPYGEWNGQTYGSYDKNSTSASSNKGQGVIYDAAQFEAAAIAGFSSYSFVEIMPGR
jgi:LysM repeat protein